MSNDARKLVDHDDTGDGSGLQFGALELTRYYSPTMTSPTENDEMEKEVNELIEPSLFRQTEGLPNLELKIAVCEATECEEALVKEIELLEAALKDESKLSEDDMIAVDQMLATEFTPPDRFWTISAVLGRLREPMATPLPPNSTLLRAQQQQQAKKKKIGRAHV